MPSSRQLISSQVLGTATSTVTFSSIPSTYTDLILKYSSRSSSTGTSQQEMYISLNGATSGTTTSQTNIYASTSTIATSVYDTSYPGWKWFNIYQPANNATSNTFINSEIYFSKYASSNQKIASIHWASENNTTNDFEYWQGVSGLKSTITAAISSITLGNQAGNFVTGSSFYLYGLLPA